MKTFVLLLMGWLLGFAGAANAKTVTSKDVLGEWEVSGYVRSRDMSVMQLTPMINYSLVGRRYVFQSREFRLLDTTFKCQLNSSYAKRSIPLRALFEQERVTRPKLITRPLYGRAKGFALSEAIGQLASRPVTVFAYQNCELSSVSDTAEEAGRFAAVGDTAVVLQWFAVAGDTVLIPYTYDTLLILKRPPAVRPAEHEAFCQAASTANDKLICQDREMWLMHKFGQDTRACVERLPGENPFQRGIAASLKEQLPVRDACNGERGCLWKALYDYNFTAAQVLGPINRCINGELQDFCNGNMVCR
jgi:hypothetical protein